VLEAVEGMVEDGRDWCGVNANSFVGRVRLGFAGIILSILLFGWPFMVWRAISNGYPFGPAVLDTLLWPVAAKPLRKPSRPQKKRCNVVGSMLPFL
jgi:hypothetical protein